MKTANLEKIKGYGLWSLTNHHRMPLKQLFWNFKLFRYENISFFLLTCPTQPGQYGAFSFSNAKYWVNSKYAANVLQDATEAQNPQK